MVAANSAPYIPRPLLVPPAGRSKSRGDRRPLRARRLRRRLSLTAGPVASRVPYLRAFLRRQPFLAALRWPAGSPRHDFTRAERRRFERRGARRDASITRPAERRFERRRLLFTWLTARGLRRRELRFAATLRWAAFARFAAHAFLAARLRFVFE